MFGGISIGVSTARFVASAIVHASAFGWIWIATRRGAAWLTRAFDSRLACLVLVACWAGHGVAFDLIFTAFRCVIGEIFGNCGTHLRVGDDFTSGTALRVRDRLAHFTTASGCRIRFCHAALAVKVRICRSVGSLGRVHLLVTST